MSPSQGGPAASVPDVRIDAARTEALADCVPASLAQVLREIGWLLVRRAQLAREGRPPRECLALLQPLAKACRAYTESMEQLRDQLMMADAVLEHLLDGAEPAPDATDTPAPIAPLDLYSVMSTLPAMAWDGTAGDNAVPASTPPPSAPVASIDAALAQAMPVTEATRTGTSASDAIDIDSDSDSDSDPAQGQSSSVPVEEAAPASSTDRRPDAPGDDLVSALLSTPLPSTDASTGAAHAQAAEPKSAPGGDSLGDGSALDFSWLDLERVGWQG
ncbi:hypothetical protein MCAP1_001767 [Malassezia caprae]|uniref:Uncharacterized protein n=1 Tax=Malassezia caprae TaxID=1381934 RepID=A0AAF0E826_9BASI|nr:hypothetical protein MCAP1_001767 [Malassezia caprae]